MSEELKRLQEKLDKLSNIMSKAGVKVETWVEISSGDFGYIADFSEHDKAFEDKIAKLEKKEKELEDKISDLEMENRNLNIRIFQNELENNKIIVEIKIPATPTEIATHLINNTCTINELEQIAEHLLVYCKHNRESE